MERIYKSALYPYTSNYPFESRDDNSYLKWFMLDWFNLGSYESAHRLVTFK